MVFNFVAPEFRVNLERISFYRKDSEIFNQLVRDRLIRSKFLPKPILTISTPGSDQYLVKGYGGIPYETVLGKKEKRGYCTCIDFQRSIKISKEKSYDYVLPCKHILKVLAYRRQTKVL